MRTGAIIFSRMNSQRLPGKALIEISGKLLIERVLIAARKIEKIDHICIATSINKDDNLIEEFADKYNVDVYRGDKSDVAMRALNASIKFGYESFIRVCGDRPFIDSHIFNDLINIHSTNFDITTNLFPRSVPPGLSAEVITVKALEKIISMTSDPINREHITKYIYENPNNFKIKSDDSKKIAKSIAMEAEGFLNQVDYSLFRKSTASLDLIYFLSKIVQHQNKNFVICLYEFVNIFSAYLLKHDFFYLT